MGINFSKNFTLIEEQEKSLNDSIEKIISRVVDYYKKKFSSNPHKIIIYRLLTCNRENHKNFKDEVDSVLKILSN